VRGAWLRSQRLLVVLEKGCPELGTALQDFLTPALSRRKRE